MIQPRGERDSRSNSMSTQLPPDPSRRLKENLLPPPGPHLRSSARHAQTPEPTIRDRIREQVGVQAPPALIALVLLWHDHAEAAHTLVQNDSSPEGCLVHAWVHRLEPDYGNAAYWFRRVGLHPLYEDLNTRTLELVRSAPPGLWSEALTNRPAWDPIALLRLWEQAASDPNPQSVDTCLQMQRMEFEGLFDLLTQQSLRPPSKRPTRGANE